MITKAERQFPCRIKLGNRRAWSAPFGMQACLRDAGAVDSAMNPGQGRRRCGRGLLSRRHVGGCLLGRLSQPGKAEPLSTRPIHFHRFLHGSALALGRPRWTSLAFAMMSPCRGCEFVLTNRRRVQWKPFHPRGRRLGISAAASNPLPLDEHWWADQFPGLRLSRAVIAIAIALGGQILAGIAIN